METIASEDALINNLGVFHNQFPARGWKQLCILILIRNHPVFKVFHNQFPARGWKHLEQFGLQRTEARRFFITNSPQGDGNNNSPKFIAFTHSFFITNSPQGDGNLHKLLPPPAHNNPPVFHNQFPARGWKRVLVAPLTLFTKKVFHNQFPARGWKRYPLKVLWRVDYLWFFITNSPQGDGNLF